MKLPTLTAICCALAIFGSGIVSHRIYHKAKSPFIELPDGMWTDANKVTSIYTLPLLPKDKWRNEAIPDRVIVVHDKMYSLIPCKSMAEAETLADAIAEQVVDLAR